MAYKGYTQCWCANGHYWEDGLYPLNCPVCNEEPEQCNEVCTTNCEDYGYVDPALFKLKDAEVKKCECCGQVQVIHPDLYRVPTDDELSENATYRDSDGNIYKL